MAKLADAVHFDYIDELCDEILDKFDCDEADKISNLIADPVVRKYLKSVIPLAKERANAQTRDK